MNKKTKSQCLYPPAIWALILKLSLSFLAIEPGGKQKKVIILLNKDGSRIGSTTDARDCASAILNRPNVGLVFYTSSGQEIPLPLDEAFQSFMLTSENDGKFPIKEMTPSLYESMKPILDQYNVTQEMIQ